MTAFWLIFFLISMFCTTTNAVRRRHRFAYCHRSSGCPSISIVPRGGGVEEENVSSQEQTFEILEEKLLFSHWRTVSSRLVRFPDGRTANFDIVGNKNSDHAVLVFAWNSQSKTATLIREYMPGSNSMKYGIAAGLVEDKHIHINGEDDDDGDDDQDGTGDIQKLIAAQHELEEECHLIGGEWIKLTDDTLLDKYASTQATVYLNLNAKIAANPKPLDAEEEIVIVPNVTIPEILEMIAKGEMNCVGAWACLVAIQRLRELGEIE